jgi:hypothetical protein
LIFIHPAQFRMIGSFDADISVMRRLPSRRRCPLRVAAGCGQHDRRVSA